MSNTTASSIDVVFVDMKGARAPALAASIDVVFVDMKGARAPAR
jgi:hypothetical protein